MRLTAASFACGSRTGRTFLLELLLLPHCKRLSLRSNSRVKLPSPKFVSPPNVSIFDDANGGGAAARRPTQSNTAEWLTLLAPPFSGAAATVFVMGATADGSGRRRVGRTTAFGLPAGSSNVSAFRTANAFDAEYDGSDSC